MKLDLGCVTKVYLVCILMIINLNAMYTEALIYSSGPVAKQEYVNLQTYITNA